MPATSLVLDGIYPDTNLTPASQLFLINIHLNLRQALIVTKSNCYSSRLLRPLTIAPKRPSVQTWYPWLLIPGLASVYPHALLISLPPPRPVQQVSIQGIASGLSVQGIGTISYTYHNDAGIPQTLHLDGALYVPQCTTRLICPRQLGLASGNANDGFQSLHDKEILMFQGQPTTVTYEPLSQLPVLYTAPGIQTFHRFCSSFLAGYIATSNLTNNQLRKRHMHERCAHAHWDQINSWIRAGLLPCEPSLANEPDPVCAACQIGKMHRKTHKTNTGHIGSEHTAPGMGVSSDGMEAGIPGKIFSTHGTPTSKSYKYATFWIDHYSKFVYVTMHETKCAEELLKSKLEFEDFAS